MTQDTGDIMTWEEELKKAPLDSYGVEGTELELYAALAGLAALGITLTFTDEDFIAGRKAFMQKIRRMLQSAKRKKGEK